eukprot:gene5803-9626_t
MSFGGFNFGSISGSTGGSSGGSGFNFGSTSSTNPSSTSSTGGGFGFGSTSTGSTGGSTGGSGFNFGSTSTGSTGGGGGSGGGFGFGSSSTGSTTGGSSGFNFGSSSGGFGSGGSNFSSIGSGSNGSGFGISNSYVATQDNTVEGAMKKIFDFYNPNSPFCRFNYFFYNISESGRVKEQLLSLREKYKEQIPDSRWMGAMENNPNPNKLVPVPARSFDDLNLRISEQLKRIKSFQNVLKLLEKELEARQRDYEVKNLKIIEQIKLKQLILNARILKLQMKLEVLMQKGGGQTSNDSKIKMKLDYLQQELHKPNQFRGRLNELVPQLNYFLQNTESFSNLPDNFEEQSLLFLIQYLSQQHDGLKELSSILNKDIKDVKKISNFKKSK